MKSQNIFFAFQVKGTVSQGFRSKHSTWVPYERAIELYFFRKMGNFPETVLIWGQVVCFEDNHTGHNFVILSLYRNSCWTSIFFNMSEIYLRKKVTDYGRLVGTYIGYRYRIFLSSVTCGRSSCRA